MSQDLFNAFGQNDVPLTSHTVKAKTNQDSGLLVDFDGLSVSSNVHTPKSHNVGADDSLWQQSTDGKQILFDADQHDDDFGDFEVVAREEGSRLPQQDQPPVSVPSGPKEPTHEHRSQGVGGKSLIDVDDLSVTTPLQEGTAAVPLNEGHATNESNIFMVTSAQDYADWGDFEDAPKQHMKITEVVPQERAESGNDASFDESWEPFEAQVDTADANRVDESELDDEWQSFDEPAEKTEELVRKAPATTQLAGEAHLPSISDGLTAQPFNATTLRRDQERPTNVPPPAILLQLLPSILQELNAKRRVSPAATGLAEQIEVVHSAGACILAGRSLRWKRDTRLAQSMRIGQAGKSGGMKLTTLDRGESIREDQEAAEVIASWSKYSSAFNTITLKVSKKRLSTLAVAMPVKTLTGPAAISAPSPCPICGLRRTERVLALPESGDVFEDFWVEHWGHRHCYDFWFTYNSMLSQR